MSTLEPPSPPPASASTSARGPRGLAGRDDGAQYLTWDELPAFGAGPEERYVNDVLLRLGSNDDWAEQFEAINDARRLTRHAPRLLAGGGHLKKLIAKIATLMESLRSALAKNALRCAGELFLAFGRKLDPEIEAVVPVILRRAADTNAFIAEEAESSLREVCRAASEPRLLAPLLSAASSRRAEIRTRAAWALAMLAQRHFRGRAAGRGLDVRAIVDAAAKAVADANADVRLFGRCMASVLVAGNAVEDGPVKAKLHASVFQGADPASFDAFDIEAIRRAAPLASGAFGAPGGGGRVRSAGSDGRSATGAKAALSSPSRHATS